MSFLHQIDNELLLKWLEELQIAHYLCGQCQGIHLSDIQSMEGVLESRLFLDEECLIFTTEIEIRNSCLFAVQAELPRINAAYAHLKAFLDATDDYNIRMIMCGTQWISAGVSLEQIDVFVRALVDAKSEVIADFQQQDYLFLAEENDAPTTPAVHLH
jgi:hypothetical protein